MSWFCDVLRQAMRRLIFAFINQYNLYMDEQHVPMFKLQITYYNNIAL